MIIPGEVIRCEPRLEVSAGCRSGVRIEPQDAHASMTA